MKYEVESRPWGMYEVLLDSPECKVKRISVAPGSTDINTAAKPPKAV